ncbi:MAG TPA: type 4a pilus biogenesis protein PilO [Syntrophorhabdaceae bacterium]|nr:type 4a pilus biogenesis protein PilO [Syntrophorhabdaceae bacterium]
MKVGFESKGLVRKIEKIPSIYKAIATIILVCVIAAGLVYFIMLPQLETRNKLTKEYGDLQKKLADLRQLKNDMEKHRKEFAEMQELLQDVLKQLPESKDIPNLLRSVTSVSEETRLKIKYFEPKEMKTKEFYSELPFEIKFSGPFHTVAYFFDGIRRMDRIVNVTDFSLEAKGTARNIFLEGTCTASAYVYARDQQRPGKKIDSKTDKGGQSGKK